MPVRSDVKYNKVTTFSDYKTNLVHLITKVWNTEALGRAQELSPYETGLNTRSIEAEVTVDGDNIIASLFTTSGYGGYLELGHRVRLGGTKVSTNLFASVRGGYGDYVQGRPYIYPATMYGVQRLGYYLGFSTSQFIYQPLDTYTGSASHARKVKKGVLHAIRKGKGSHKKRLARSTKVIIG